jgi:protein-S-isoprenylcysteine O-methyltransferase Ste14
MPDARKTTGVFFDPFAILERSLPAPWPHRLLRGAVIALLLVFLAHRAASYGTYLFKPLWVVETLIFVVFIVSYAVRADPTVRSRGAAEMLIPLAGAVMPFALLLSPQSRLFAGHHARLIGLFSWMTASTAFTVWGLWTLRRSFSVTVEVRGLVAGGPYRYVRHPVYLGEIATAAAVTLLRLTPLNVAIFLVFSAVQLFRSRMEEAKLTRALPGYAAYAQRRWWLLPPTQ